MDFNEKLKEVRRSEGITQAQLADITGLPLSNIKKIEAGYHEPGWRFVSQITSNLRFKKYALWLITGDIAPEIGQISPALSLDGSEKREDAPNSTPNTLKSRR